MAKTGPPSGTFLPPLPGPRTADVAVSPWALVPPVARTCLLAKAASTAAVVLGDKAPEMLAHEGVPARLVRQDRTVVVVGSWPPDLAPVRPAY